MKSNNDQDSCDPSSDLNKQIRECEDMMTRYWNENPDLLEAVKEKKETAKIIAELWKDFPKLDGFHLYFRSYILKSRRVFCKMKAFSN